MHIFEITDAENWREFASRRESRMVCDGEPPIGEAVIRFGDREIAVNIVKAMDILGTDYNLWVAHIEYKD